jgi:hypothetical protein
MNVTVSLARLERKSVIVLLSRISSKEIFEDHGHGHGHSHNHYHGHDHNHGHYHSDIYQGNLSSAHRNQKHFHSDDLQVLLPVSSLLILLIVFAHHTMTVTEIMTENFDKFIKKPRAMTRKKRQATRDIRNISLSPRETIMY